MQTTQPSPPAQQTPPPALVLGAQTAFNIGFYAIIPFLALILAEDFLLGATAIGIILGIRTFAQQGMFLIGGALADSFGPRLLMLFGVAIRVIGFLALGAGPILANTSHGAGLTVFILGTILTGLGGALFSPSVNLYIAQADQILSRQEANSVKNRTTLFAWLNVTGEIGAVLGPLIGYALIGLGFPVVAWGGALLFTLLWIGFWFLLPRIHTGNQSSSAKETRIANTFSRVLAVIHDKKFARFAVCHSVDLFCYNQLYFALPLVASLAAQDSHQLLAAAFALVSALTLLGQVPLSKFSNRFPARKVLVFGYCTSALGLSLFALSHYLSQVQGQGSGFTSAQALVLLGTFCVGIGHLSASPKALSYAAENAPATAKAAYLGFIATCGGFTVLLGNLLLGGLLDALTAFAPGTEWLVWLLAAAIVLTAAALQRSLPTRTS